MSIMTTKTIAEPTALELKGGLYTLTAIRLYSTDRTLFLKQLEDKIKQAPKFFYCAPVILDLSYFAGDFPTQPENLLQPILAFLRQVHLIPVGIVPMQGATGDFIESVRALGMAIISESRKLASNTRTPKNEPIVEQLVEAPQLTLTRTVTQPIRSGQQIYAPNGDLLALNAVSHGAELLADGHIHVYGPLRGRALAGISGNEEAHIFCQSLEAELISIAGRYRISEDLKDDPLWKKSVRIFLEKGKLQIAKL